MNNFVFDFFYYRVSQFTQHRIFFTLTTPYLIKFYCCEYDYSNESLYITQYFITKSDIIFILFRLLTWVIWFLLYPTFNLDCCFFYSSTKSFNLLRFCLMILLCFQNEFTILPSKMLAKCFSHKLDRVISI